MNNPEIGSHLRPHFLLLALLVTLALSPLFGLQQTQSIDQAYTDKIREFTTEEFFLTRYVDYLPASSTVPTPLDVLGHIAGAADVLSYSDEVHRYMRAVADASPRVRVFTMGQSEEGREMILVVASSEETIANLNRYKQINARLADPRTITDAEARNLIGQAKPMYWATGAMHSGETGSPEMLMELIYRLAVDESSFIREIREKAIVMMTPIQEVDGRDKRVDLLKLKQHDPEARIPSLLYWGKYVAHDNNRDALSLSLALSKHTMRTFLEYHPQIMHDLHESQPHLYTSTGTGPYNAWIDPILVDEWQTLAYQEITEMTKMGVPGVWTHAFYDGWAPNYAFYAANGHNAIGRFYETQGAGNADTRKITTRSTNRAWYRPNPPLPEVMWSMRNNVNLQQSAILIAMNYVANHKDQFMENFYLKSKRSVAKATTEGPAAYIFPGDDPRPGQQALLLNLLRRQGGEVHRAVRAFQVGDQEFSAGSYVMRMDQPYSRMMDMMLDRGYYNVNDPRPYDDTGWTLGPLYNARTVRIDDASVLDVHMELVKGEIKPVGGVEILTQGATVAFIINHNADNLLATFRFQNPNLILEAAEAAFDLGGMSFNAGTFIVKKEANPGNLESRLAREGEDLGFSAYRVSSLPDVPTHPVSLPKVALVHTWVTTQSEGWVRMALDELGVPYDYISVHEVRDEANLKTKYDVILIGPTRNPQSILQGLPKTGKPVAWKKTDVTPNLGRQDSTDDMRSGLEFEGLIHLRNFVQAGGLLITLAGSSQFPIHYGLTEGVSIQETRSLQVRGSVLNARFGDRGSPISYGYDETLGVYFSQSPVFRMGGRGFGRRGRRGGGSATTTGPNRPTGRGTVDDPDIVQGRPRDLGKQGVEEFEANADAPDNDTPPGPRPRAILSFEKDAGELLISGMLTGGQELAGTPAVVDAKVGDGHIVLFGINPMWRHETHGSFFLVLNAMLHYDHLDLEAPPNRQQEAPVEAGSRQ